MQAGRCIHVGNNQRAALAMLPQLKHGEQTPLPPPPPHPPTSPPHTHTHTPGPPPMLTQRSLDAPAALAHDQELAPLPRCQHGGCSWVGWDVWVGAAAAWVAAQEKAEKRGAWVTGAICLSCYKTPKRDRGSALEVLGAAAASAHAPRQAKDAAGKEACARVGDARRGCSRAERALLQGGAMSVDAAALQRAGVEGVIRQAARARRTAWRSAQ